jgi:hypothetical protein
MESKTGQKLKIRKRKFSKTFAVEIEGCYFLEANISQKDKE